jgi:hypothetical protein
MLAASQMRKSMADQKTCVIRVNLSGKCCMSMCQKGSNLPANKRSFCRMRMAFSKERW